MTPSQPDPNAALPLVLILEQDLIGGDLIAEAFLAVIKHRPTLILPLLLSRFSGRTSFRRRVLRESEKMGLDATALPYRPETLARIAAERARGSQIHLISLLSSGLARRIAYRHGIQEGPPAGGAGRPLGGSPPVRNWVKASIRACRPHQWAKNSLLFVPLVLSHQILHAEKFFHELAAFFAFSFFASSVYLVNDLLDIESDRAHPTKFRRPFASGELPIRAVIYLVPLLWAGAFALAFPLLPLPFLGVLGFYLLCTGGYTFGLNRKPILDILVLAGLYALRLLAGSVAVGVPASPWLLGFSLFFFLSLATLKRYVELVNLRDAQAIKKNRAGYATSDLQLLISNGVSCGYLSVLVFALYLNSPAVTRLYPHPTRLWGICVLLLCWINRMWFIAHRGGMTYDPVVFALKDRVSLALLGLTLIGLTVASL